MVGNGLHDFRRVLIALNERLGKFGVLELLPPLDHLVATHGQINVYAVFILERAEIFVFRKLRNLFEHRALFVFNSIRLSNTGRELVIVFESQVFISILLIVNAELVSQFCNLLRAGRVNRLKQTFPIKQEVFATSFEEYFKPFLKVLLDDSGGLAASLNAFFVRNTINEQVDIGLFGR